MNRSFLVAVFALTGCAEDVVAVPTPGGKDAAIEDAGSTSRDAAMQDAPAVTDAALESGPASVILKGPTDGSKTGDQVCAAAKDTCDPTHLWSPGDGVTSAAACVAEYVDELKAHQWKRYTCAELAPPTFVKNQHTNTLLSLECACLQ